MMVSSYEEGKCCFENTSEKNWRKTCFDYEGYAELIDLTHQRRSKTIYLNIKEEAKRFCIQDA